MPDHRPTSLTTNLPRPPIYREIRLTSSHVLSLAETTSKVVRDGCVQENLREKTRQALQASQAKSEFLANMSHEIRTPMTAILGFSDLLQMPDLAKDEQHEFVDGIQRNARLLLQLISDILDLSKIEAGSLTLETGPCCPRQIAEDVVTMLAERATSKGLALNLACDPALPDTILTDPIRLRQILVNLIGNAIKFTEQGHVRVTLFRRQSPLCQQVVFEVSDTGIGIPAHRFSELFKPFSQVDASATRRFGGTGLGLALVKRLTQAMGANIAVTSCEGVGSTFTLIMEAPPQHSCASSQAMVVPHDEHPDPLPVEPAVARQGRVLLIEDNPEVQLVMAHLLRSLHIAVEVAENGQSGCERVQAALKAGTCYDLILMDIQMPVIDGLEATRRLRSTGWTGPIVALTAHAMSGDAQKCLEAGCDEYASKPLSLPDLQRLLQKYCEVAPAARDS